MTTKKVQYGLIWMGLTVVLMLAAAACSATAKPTPVRTPRPTPTPNCLFQKCDDRGTDSKPVSNATATPIPTPIPTRVPVATLRPEAELPPPIPIFDDALGLGWTTKYSSMPHQLDFSAETFEGRYAIRMSPAIGERSLLFTLESNARPVREERVLGISFEIFSGSEGLSNEEVAMGIIGSDSSTYWIKNDTSTFNVRNPNPDWLPADDPISNLYGQNFSETLISFMGIERDIAPNTWVEGINYLDDRIYDPLYKNIVGFYFKTETTVRHDILIDNVQLIVIGSE